MQTTVVTPVVLSYRYVNFFGWLWSFLIFSIYLYSIFPCTRVQLSKASDWLFEFIINRGSPFVVYRLSIGMASWTAALPLEGSGYPSLWPINVLSKAPLGNPVLLGRRLSFTLSKFNKILTRLSIYFRFFSRVSGSNCPELGVLYATSLRGNLLSGLQYGSCRRYYSMCHFSKDKNT